MRIISGTHQGRVIKVPKDLPVRPTTDFAKEGLFNILNNKIDYSESKVLDLFSGTGHISLEFASRGSKQILSIDKNFKCVGFLKATSKELKFDIDAIKSDVFDFLKKCNQKFDIVFADPPYDMPDIQGLVSVLMPMLADQGWLIIEHKPQLVFAEQELLKKEYGSTTMTIFAKE